MAAIGGAGQSGNVALHAGIESLLVGRTQEQRVLREELLAAINGHGRLVLLGGEAGIGKTTLARDLCQEAMTLGVRVLHGHCYDLATTPPYGPWVDLFETARLLPGSPTPPPALTAGTNVRVSDQAALFAEVRRFFAEFASTGPVLLILEDLHWADPASVDLLRSLSVALNHWPILLIATYRMDELSRHHPLYQQLPALVREANALRLNLGAIDSRALRDLVNGRFRLSAVDESRLVAYLDHHSDGNPFFAVELIRALEEAGLLRRGDDRSSLGELDRIVVPALLRQVIDGRVARLGEEIRERLEIGAVIGHEVPLDLWARVADLDEEGLIGVVDKAVAADLLDADHAGTRVRFVHALTREALYAGILPLRRRFWHRRVAEVLALEEGADPDAVALHFQLAGDQRAIDWLIRAGERASRVYAWVMAAERMRSAAALLKDLPGQSDTYRELVFRSAYLIRFADPGSSLTALDEVVRLAGDAGDRIVEAEAQHIRGIQLCYVDRFRDGLTAMSNGLETLESPSLASQRTYDGVRFWFAHHDASSSPGSIVEDASVVDRLHAVGFDARRCTYPWSLASSGHSNTALEMADRCISALDNGLHASGWISALLAFAIHGRATASAALGRPDDARRAWAQSPWTFGEVSHFALITFTLLNEVRDVALTYGAADPANRRQLAAEAERTLAQAGGAFYPDISPRLAWLGCYALDGRWEEADRILKDLPVPGNCYLRREVTATIAMLGRYRGQPEVAWAQIRIVMPDGPATEPGDSIHQEGLVLQRLAVDLCLDNGDLPNAKSWLEAHDCWLDWSESVLGRADGLVSWARWAFRSGDASRAQTLANQGLALAASPPQPLVQLAAHRLLGEVAISTEDYPAAHLHLASARTLAESCEAPYERALTLLSVAELQLATDEARAALELLDAVRDIGTPMEARLLLDQVEAVVGRASANLPSQSYPAGLTQREVDVLRLVAQHKTDKEIAEALFLSPRTVQTHVANILNKLGVENRRAATAEALRLAIA